MSKKIYTIGRAGDITLYDDTVSRRHACLEIEDDHLLLTDLDSRNGTYELRDDELVPFSEGEVRPEQVFAFGECVRSVAQLLMAADPDGDHGAPSDASAAQDGEDPMDKTRVGMEIAPRKRLTSANIIEMLERAEDDVAAGRDLPSICSDLGITVQRYERWCREYGGTRAEREQTLIALRRENERLRKLVADLSLERDAVKDALRTASEDDPGNDQAKPVGTLGSPSLTLVGDGKRKS